MNALILIDIQNDFLLGGSLEVPKGDEIIDNINSIMNNYSMVVATKDWHPKNHISFASNHNNKKAGQIITINNLDQILWPDHCIKDSKGSEFSEKLDFHKIHKIFYKGVDSNIDSYSGFYDNGKINGVLIVAPKGVVKTWHEQEIPTHLVDHIPCSPVLWQAMISQKQQRQLDTLFQPGHDLHVLIMNVEAFSTKKGLDFANKFLLSHNALVAVDESTTIKNPGAKRTKNIISIAPRAQYRRILTGSPVTKNPLDLYSQCEFLDPWLLDFTSYYAFRNRYAEMKTMYIQGRSIQVVDKFKNLHELSEQLKEFSLTKIHFIIN